MAKIPRRSAFYIEFQLNWPLCPISPQCHALISDGSLALCTASEQFNLIYLKNKLYEGEYSPFVVKLKWLKKDDSISIETARLINYQMYIMFKKDFQMLFIMVSDLCYI